MPFDLSRAAGGVPAVLSALAATAAAAAPAFTEISLDAGFAVEQPVISARLGDGDDRHVVLAGRDDEFRQRLAVFRLDGAAHAELVRSLVVTPDLLAYDVGRLGGEGEKLYFLTPGRVLAYDVAGDRFAEVAVVGTLYAQERSAEIAPLDFLRDLDDDGRDDLVLPDAGGYRVRLQGADGALGGESLLRGTVAMSVEGDTLQFRRHPLFSADLNFDGLVDVAVWRGNRLHAFHRAPDGHFAGEAAVLPLALDLPGEAELRALDMGQGAVDQSRLTVERIQTVKDLSGDGLPDIVTEATVSEGVFDKRNEFRLHLGRRDGDRLVYAEDADSLLASDGLQFGLTDIDVDGDRRLDLMVSGVRLNFGRVVAALFSGTVPLRLEFYRMDDAGAYPEKASFSTRTKVRFDLRSGQVDIPAVEVADFDGDLLKDLLVQRDSERLVVYRGEASERLFARDGSDVTVALPRNGELVSALDLDGDERSDLAIRYNAADGEQAAHTVRLLIARKD